LVVGEEELGLVDRGLLFFAVLFSRTLGSLCSWGGGV